MSFYFGAWVLESWNCPFRLISFPRNMVVEERKMCADIVQQVNSGHP